MPSENLTLVRETFEAFARGDIGAVIDRLDPEVEWKQIEEPVAVVGPEAVLEAIGRWTEMWDDVDVSIREEIEAGDHVVLLLHWSGRSKTGGVPVEQSAYNVFTLEGGKVVRMQEYGTDSRADALDAAGLPE